MYDSYLVNADRKKDFLLHTFVEYVVAVLNFLWTLMSAWEGFTYPFIPCTQYFIGIVCRLEHFHKILINGYHSN